MTVNLKLIQIICIVRNTLGNAVSFFSIVYNLAVSPNEDFTLFVKVLSRQVTSGCTKTYKN